MVVRGNIHATIPVQPGQLQPSSIDLRLGARAWPLLSSFLPGSSGVRRKLERLALNELSLDTERPTLFQHDTVYLVEVEESLELPPGVWGRANPKSSSGRLDIFVRLLTEHGHAFDLVPAGYRGRLYLEVTPQSFHTLVRRGDTLGQLRLAEGRPRLDAEGLAHVQATTPVIRWSDGRAGPLADDDTPGVQMSVDLHDGDGNGIVGYQARIHRPPIDLARRDYEKDRYWSPIPADPVDEGVVLEPEQFYIFATRERLSIPPGLCAELVPFDATKGELRTHYAGFIDSGFGHPGVDGQGARLVLEIRTRDVPFLLEHGQPLFRVELMQNRTDPDVLYGRELASNYQMQGLKLAKQFR